MIAMFNLTQSKQTKMLSFTKRLGTFTCGPDFIFQGGFVRPGMLSIVSLFTECEYTSSSKRINILVTPSYEGQISQ